jgi:hypothetical protein
LALVKNVKMSEKEELVIFGKIMETLASQSSINMLLDPKTGAEHAKLIVDFVKLLTSK